MRTALRLSLGALVLFGLTTPASEPPPTVIVESAYPGANAQTVAETVAAPIELQVRGVEKALYLASRCASDGSYTLSVTFKPGVDLDKARVLVRKRIDRALSALPDEVKRHGVTVKKKSPGVLFLVGLSSPDGTRDNLYLSNYASIQIKDELLRLPGVGEVASLGQQDYALRIWLDPEKLAARKLTARDVTDAIRESKAPVAPGKIGQPPVSKGQTIPLTTLKPGRLPDLEQLENIIVKSGSDGRVVYLKDVARLDLGAAGPQTFTQLNGKHVVLLGVFPSEPVRSRELSNDLRKKVSQLRARLPKGVDLDVLFDFTPNWEAPGKPATPEYLLLDPELPATASVERLAEVLARCDRLLRDVKGVQDVLALSESPFDFPAKRACLLVRLAPAGKRQATREAITRAIRKQLDQTAEMSLRVRDLSGRDSFPRCGYPVALAVHGPEADKVRKLAGKLSERLRDSKKLTDVGATSESAPCSQLSVEIDRITMKNMGVSTEGLFTTLQTYLGSVHVNDFNRFGRTWRVNVQADPAVRGRTEDLRKLKVRNEKGEMVPLGSLAKIREVEAPLVVDRLDGHPMVEITANPAAGAALAEVRALCETLAAEVRKELKLPAEYRLTWLRELPAS
ncbi:MAG TPA: efflux RND transporter permease subunit, partial [Gemmataceae bacterium]|nr:efflux RND transporter permease subunit [Gemmataceae bacterium]